MQTRLPKTHITVFPAGFLLYISKKSPTILIHTMRIILNIIALLGSIGSLVHTAGAQSAADLSVVSHIEGHWKGQFNGGPIEASWSAPEGNNIVGYIRMIRDDKPSLYEIFAFEQTDKGPLVRVKHFKPGLISVEEKEEADTYHFIESRKNEALFEKSDKKVRILYELRKPDVFVIRKGTPKEGAWEFTDLFVFSRSK